MANVRNESSTAFVEAARTAVGTIGPNQVKALRRWFNLERGREERSLADAESEPLRRIARELIVLKKRREP